MPYDLSLEPDSDRGGVVYRAALSGELDAGAVRELSDWLADARLNPDASFLLDLSEATGTNRRARIELRALLRRHRELQAQRRLSVLAPPGRSLAVALAPAAALLTALPL